MPMTWSPTEYPGLRDSMTSPTAKARILSAIHPRIAGSTDRYELRTRNSLSFGAGIGASRIAKSSARGMPFGRDFSQTWRLTWLPRKALFSVMCFSQESQCVARQEEVARALVEMQRIQPLERCPVLDDERVVCADAQLGRTEGRDQMREGRRVVHQRVLEQAACLFDR